MVRKTTGTSMIVRSTLDEPEEGIPSTPYLICVHIARGIWLLKNATENFFKIWKYIQLSLICLIMT